MKHVGSCSSARVSSFPCRLLCGGGEKSAWYTLFAHAPNSLEILNDEVRALKSSKGLRHGHSTGLGFILCPYQD